MTDLAHRTMKNSAYNFIGFVWPIILSFVSTPFIINRLGITKYGSLVLLYTIVGFFTLLDIGFSYTFFKKLSENKGLDDKDALSKLFSSTFYIYCALGIVVFLLINFSQSFLVQFLNLRSTDVLSYRIVFLLLGASFFIKMLYTTFSVIPVALQRIDIHNKIFIVNATLLQSANIYFVIRGNGITTLIGLQVCSALFLLAAFYWFWKKYLPEIKLIRYFSFSIFTRIFKNGAAFFWSDLMKSILYQLDKIVLGAVSGPAATAFYSSSQMITDKIQGISTSLSYSLVPVYSNIGDSDNIEKTYNIYKRVFRMISFIAFGLSLVLIIYGYKILFYWLGPEIADNSIVAVYFLIPTYFLLSLAFGPMNNLFVGLKKLKFLVSLNTTLAIANLIFLLILIPIYSVNGAAAAFLISALPVLLFIFFVEKNIFKANSRTIFSFHLKSFFKSVLTGAVVYALSYFLFLPFLTNIFAVLLGCGASLVLFAAFYKLFRFFDGEDWELFVGFAKKVFINKLKRT